MNQIERNLRVPAKRETAKSTAHLNCSSLNWSWLEEEEELPVRTSEVTGKGGNKTDDGVKVAADVSSRISIDRTELASKSSDSSAIVANLDFSKRIQFNDKLKYFLNE